MARRRKNRPRNRGRKAAEKHTPTVAGTCTCGGTWSADAEQHTIVHSMPTCDDFMDLESSEYLKKMRLEAQKKALN